MAIDRDTTEERQDRLNILIEQFRVAQQARIVKRGIALWRRTETDLAAECDAVPPALKPH